MSDGRLDGRLLSWDNFRDSFLDPPLAVEIPIDGRPTARIFVEPGGRRVGLRIQDLPASAVAAVSSQAVEVWRDEHGFVVISVADAELFKPFYSLALDLCDRVQLDGLSVADALQLAMRSWRRLLSARQELTVEQQLGLSGELWALRRLILSHGLDAVDSWHGPQSDIHDFRLQMRELEVKVTRSERRRHAISDMDQLVPSTRCDLYLLSLQFVATTHEGGWTLGGQIAQIRELIETNAAASTTFDERLTLLNWRDEAADSYATRWMLRSEPKLYFVANDFPRLTSESAFASSSFSAHIDQVGYRLTVEGLDRYSRPLTAMGLNLDNDV